MNPTNEQVARKAADEIIDWIAGPEPWQERERADMTDRIHSAIKQAATYRLSEMKEELREDLSTVVNPVYRDGMIRCIVHLESWQQAVQTPQQNR